MKYTLLKDGVIVGYRIEELGEGFGRTHWFDVDDVEVFHMIDHDETICDNGTPDDTSDDVYSNPERKGLLARAWDYTKSLFGFGGVA